MSTETTIINVGGWTFRQRNPDGNDPQRILLLLHGWTGDENSMWIFTPRLPKSYLIISPRGIFNTPFGGYGWQENSVMGWPKAGDFQASIEALLDMVDSLDFPGINHERFDLMGFSQGAALAYVLALMYPDRIDKLAGLSGFLPEGLASEIEAEPLQGRKVFVAHGQKDEMVPISRARYVVQGMKDAGADVLYCEEDVGHKLSSGCFRGLEEYFANPQ
jgi:phospholipase/carboxylesterase